MPGAFSTVPPDIPRPRRDVRYTDAHEALTIQSVQNLLNMICNDGVMRDHRVTWPDLVTCHEVLAAHNERRNRLRPEPSALNFFS